MVRGRRTARKQTGGSSRAYRALFVPAQPAPPAQPPPPAPVVEEEDPEEVHFFEEQEDPADPSASPLVVPVPSPAQEEQAEEEDSVEQTADEQAVGEQAAGEQVAAGAAAGGAYTETLTSVHETGPFCRLLEEALETLGMYVRPLYYTTHVIDPLLEDYYLTTVHIRETAGSYTSVRTRSSHDSDTPHLTYAASVSTAARRALTALRHEFAAQLEETRFRFVPRRQSGTEETFLLTGEAEDEYLNTALRYTAALSTDLDNATTELAETRGQLEVAKDRIFESEAQLAGQDPPAAIEEYPEPAESPKRRKFSYRAPGSGTHLE